MRMSLKADDLSWSPTLPYQTGSSVRKWTNLLQDVWFCGLLFRRITNLFQNHFGNHFYSLFWEEDIWKHLLTHISLSASFSSSLHPSVLQRTHVWVRMSQVSPSVCGLSWAPVPGDTFHQAEWMDDLRKVWPGTVRVCGDSGHRAPVQQYTALHPISMSSLLPRPTHSQTKHLHS